MHHAKLFRTKFVTMYFLGARPAIGVENLEIWMNDCTKLHFVEMVCGFMI
jgi:hypothetical protein